jgi:hypothetical protein
MKEQKKKRKRVLIVKIGKPWRCECGVKYTLSAYVIAHWNIKLIHTCVNCKRKHGLHSGVLSTL